MRTNNTQPTPGNLRVIRFLRSWSPDAAYTLGLIASDGCVHFGTTRTRHNWIVSISQSGAEGGRLLRRIRDAVGAGGLHVRPGCVTKFGKTRPSWQLVWSGRHVYEAVRALGLPPRKSLTLRMPKVPPAVLRHFVRGVLDGDGCVSVTRPFVKSGRHRCVKLSAFVTTCSSRFAAGLARALAAAGHPPRVNILRHGSGTVEHRVIFSGGAAERLLRWTHAEGGLHLPAKRARFEQYLCEKAAYDAGRSARLVRAGKRWPEAMESRLRALLADGRPLPAVAAALGRSTTAVKNRMRALGLRTGYYWTDADRAAAAALLSAGRPVREVAAAVGRPLATVRRFAARLRRAG